jgi:uncharacterized protein with HEPN domain
MPSDTNSLALRDILENGRLAQSFVEGMSEADFTRDRRTFYAVTRCLEIVSEACRRLQPELRDRYPNLPWRAIMGIGNVYRHDYDNVAEAIVWRTVRHSLDPLLSIVEREISGS